MECVRNFSALILAAGASSRMGALKPLLPLGQETVIEKVVGCFQEAGVPDIRVVLGYEADQLQPVLNRLGVAWVMNPEYPRGMLSSVQAGVRDLGKECPAFYLMPADMPFVRAATIEALALAFTGWGSEGGSPVTPLVCHPCHQGRRGHPPLISGMLMPEILAFDEPGGVKRLLARYENRSCQVDVDDPGILIDLDTPEDYGAYPGGC